MTHGHNTNPGRIADGASPVTGGAPSLIFGHLNIPSRFGISELQYASSRRLLDYAEAGNRAEGTEAQRRCPGDESGSERGRLASERSELRPSGSWHSGVPGEGNKEA